MNVHEYGVVFAFSTGYNMAANTSLHIEFWKPSNPWTNETDETPSLTVTAALGVGSITTTVGIFTTETYVTYTFANGDVDESGLWSARVIYDSASKHLISDVGQFTVGE